MGGFVWPEQEAVDTWAKRYGINASAEELYELKEAVTKTRLAVQDRLKTLEIVAKENYRIYENTLVENARLRNTLFNPNVEALASKVHNAWWEEKMLQGFHNPLECPHRTPINPHGKFEKICDKCHRDMYPYEELPENIKDYDRVTVKAVLKALAELDKKGEKGTYKCQNCQNLVESEYTNRLFCSYHSDGEYQHETFLDDYCNYFESKKEGER